MVWVAGVGGALLLAVAALVAYVAVTAPPDDHYWVYQESVNEAISEPCGQMQIAGEAIPEDTTTPAGRAAMLHFSQVARKIPEAIDEVPEADDDAIYWRDGWLQVIEAVEAYSSAGGVWVSPLDESGVRITDHMTSSTDVQCELPTAVLLLEYPEIASQNG